jgi:membrane protein YqaA with SNARE-associated domain
LPGAPWIGKVVQYILGTNKNKKKKNKKKKQTNKQTNQKKKKRHMEKISFYFVTYQNSYF